MNKTLPAGKVFSFTTESSLVLPIRQAARQAGGNGRLDIHIRTRSHSLGIHMDCDNHRRHRLLHNHIVRLPGLRVGRTHHPSLK